MNNFKKRLIICAVFFCSVTAFAADSDAVKEAEKLLDVTTKDAMNKNLDRMLDAMIDLQVAQNPAMAPFKATMKKFFATYLSYESIKPGLIEFYLDHFTLDELKETNAFYATQAGKKWVELSPKLMTEATKIVQEKVQAHLPELKQMMQDEIQRRNDK